MGHKLCRICGEDLPSATRKRGLCFDCHVELKHFGSTMTHEERMDIRDNIRDSWDDRTEVTRRAGYELHYIGDGFVDLRIYWYPNTVSVVVDHRKYLEDRDAWK
jgi:hypothetical protein